MKKNVTFNDIAEYTGFSKTTISRYFNSPDSLTLENQQKIAAALVALDYKENKVARILANGKTEFIGVIIPNMTSYYYSEILDKILATYDKYGYKFLVFAGNEHRETERKYIEELLAYKIEGMIILSHTIPSEELASYNIPIVTIEREDKYVSSVNTDNYMGGKQAAELLVKSGCNVLIHINSDVSEEVPAYGRITGFCDICKDRNIPYELILTDMGNSYEEASVNINNQLDAIEKKYSEKCKGIFMSNDTHANILLNILIRKYGRLPDDFKIVGFDNSSISREAIIPISTVGQQIEIMADNAMELLLMQINERKKRKPTPLESTIHRTIAPILFPRDTTDVYNAKQQ